MRSLSVVRDPSAPLASPPALRVADAMRPLARCVMDAAPVTEVLRALVDEANPVVAVVSASGRLLGTISERDVLHCLPPASTPGAAAIAYARFLGLRAVDVMAEIGLTVCEDDPLDLALDVLAGDEVPSLAVVDPAGRPVGIVTAVAAARATCDAPALRSAVQ